MEQLGEYLVRRLIGEGGMGKVYEAEERLSKRRVALKVLRQELSRSEEGRRLFLNEMQILAHLEHPNIVRSLASTEVDGELVMVLEYLDGRTLRTVLGAGPLPWGEAIRIVASAAAALGAAHGQEPPIIHRDLKPENIMLLTDGTVKVMDFGIAKVIQAMNQTNTQSVGTLQYMSPEQIDAHTIDHRSDLYCLGLVLYELIAGQPPFQSASPRQLLNLQCTAEPPPLPDEVREGLPRGVEQLVFQLLEKAPEDRPYLASDVVDRLDPFQTAGRAAPRCPPARALSNPGAGAVQRTPPGAGREALAAAASLPSPASAPAPSPAPAPRSAPKQATADAADTEKSPLRGEKGGGRGDRAPAPALSRSDTVALVDRVDAGRQVPTGLAVAIIVGLSAVAGLSAYGLRSAGSPRELPATGATALIPTPAPGAPGNR